MIDAEPEPSLTVEVRMSRVAHVSHVGFHEFLRCVVLPFAVVSELQDAVVGVAVEHPQVAIVFEEHARNLHIEETVARSCGERTVGIGPVLEELAVLELVDARARTHHHVGGVERIDVGTADVAVVDVGVLLDVVFKHQPRAVGLQHLDGGLAAFLFRHPRGVVARQSAVGADKIAVAIAQREPPVVLQVVHADAAGGDGERRGRGGRLRCVALLLELYDALVFRRAHPVAAVGIVVGEAFHVGQCIVIHAVAIHLIDVVVFCEDDMLVLAVDVVHRFHVVIVVSLSLAFRLQQLGAGDAVGRDVVLVHGIHLRFVAQSHDGLHFVCHLESDDESFADVEMVALGRRLLRPAVAVEQVVGLLSHEECLLFLAHGVDDVVFHQHRADVAVQSERVVDDLVAQVDLHHAEGCGQIGVHTVDVDVVDGLVLGGVFGLVAGNVDDVAFGVEEVEVVVVVDDEQLLGGAAPSDAADDVAAQPVALHVFVDGLVVQIVGEHGVGGQHEHLVAGGLYVADVVVAAVGVPLA